MKHQAVIPRGYNRLLHGADSAAAAQDITIGHLVRQLLKQEVERRLGETRCTQTDARLLAALQVLLGRDMAAASGWDDLKARLRPHGYDLRPAGDGLRLHKTSCSTCICNLSELGFPYRTLVQRFRAGMPGHPQGVLNLMFRALPEADIDVIDMD